jgi:hypothetical protein
VGRQLDLELFFGEGLGVVFGTFGCGLGGRGGGGRVDAGFFFFLTAVLFEKVGGEAFHSEDLDVVAVSTGECVLQPIVGAR